MSTLVEYLGYEDREARHNEREENKSAINAFLGKCHEDGFSS